MAHVLWDEGSGAASGQRGASDISDETEAGLRQEEYACPDQKIMNEKVPSTDRKNPCIGAFQHEDYKHSAGNTFT